MVAAAGTAAAGIGIAVLVILYVVLIAGSLVFFILALVDIVKRPDWQWKLAGQEKVLWLLLVILINFLAIPSLIYWFHIRKKLMGVERAALDGRFGPGHLTYGGWEPGPPPAPYAPGVPPGWHADPRGRSPFRWWDGVQWTEHTWGSSAAGPEGPYPTG